MKFLGYDFLKVVKCYYVDKHDAKETIEYRENTFLPAYWRAEIRAADRWVQIPVEEAQAFEDLPEPS